MERLFERHDKYISNVNDNDNENDNENVNGNLNERRKLSTLN